MQPGQALVIGNFANHAHPFAESERGNACLDFSPAWTVTDDSQLRIDLDQRLNQDVETFVRHETPDEEQ